MIVFGITNGICSSNQEALLRSNVLLFMCFTKSNWRTDSEWLLFKVGRILFCYLSWKDQSSSILIGRWLCLPQLFFVRLCLVSNVVHVPRLSILDCPFCFLCLFVLTHPAEACAKRWSGVVEWSLRDSKLEWSLEDSKLEWSLDWTYE